MNMIPEKFYLIFFCLLILTLLSCTGNETQNQNSMGPEIISNPEYGMLQQQDPPPFEFELIREQEIDFGDEQVIANVSSMSSDSEGNFYFVDNRNSKLISFTPDGEVRFVTGQLGQGPGDINRAYSMEILRDTLFIGNQSGSRIDLFDLNGEFIRSKTLPSYISFGRIIGEIRPGVLMIGRSLMGEAGTELLAVDLRSEITDSLYSIPFMHAEGLELPDGMSAGAEVKLFDDRLYPGYFSPYKIRVADLQGNILKVIGRDFDKMAMPGFHEQEGSAMIMDFGSLTVENVLEDGTIIALALHPTEKIESNDYVRKRMNGDVSDLKYGRSRDFYDTDGQLLYSIEYGPEDDFIGYDYADRSGIFYRLDYSGEQPVLKTWRLIRN